MATTNSIGPNGLTIKSLPDLVADLSAGLRAIYGADINLDPNSADGQFVNLFALACIDQEELVQLVNANFDPDQAVGIMLDLRCAINGVVRKGGTRTTQLVTVTVTQALTLAGVDTAPDAPFTISDAAGNQFQLGSAHSFGGAGSANLTFQAAQIGALTVVPNTLTNVVTIQLGVASVTNGSLAGTTGTNEESDYLLRIRRQQSGALPSTGFLAGILAALLAIETVTDAVVLENVTSTTDANGIPGHSIWAIVAGGADADVAQAIYVHRNAGCGMKGGLSVNVTQVDGSTFAILFDRPTPETLWIELNMTAITGSAPATTYIRTQLLALLSYEIGQPADASAITALLKTIAPNCYFDTVNVSNVNSGYVPLKATATVDSQWALAAIRIYINGSLS